MGAAGGGQAAESPQRRGVAWGNFSGHHDHHPGGARLLFSAWDTALGSAQEACCQLCDLG